MTRAQLLGISLAAGALVGGVSVAGETLLGGTATLVATVLVACVAVWVLGRVLITRRLPTVVRAHLVKQLDPDAGSPADSAPIALDLADRWIEAVNARDWAALGDLLTDDVRLEGAVDKPVFGRRMYMRTARVMARAYPDFRAVVEEVVAQPAEPTIAWVRLTETGTPRGGPPLDVTWWERWTLDDTEQRIREIHIAGVVRLS